MANARQMFALPGDSVSFKGREGQRFPGLSGNAILAGRYLARQNFIQFADVMGRRSAATPVQCASELKSSGSSSRLTSCRFSSDVGRVLTRDLEIQF